MSLIYEKRVHSLEDRVDELERRVPDDLAAFIDELVERTARRVVELQNEQAEELRVAMAKRRAETGLAGAMAAVVRQINDDIADQVAKAGTSGVVADWPDGVEVE